MIDFETALEQHIEAEVERRVEARLGQILEKLGVSATAPQPPETRNAAAGGQAARVTRPRRPVSAETRARMKAAWARRKADRDATGVAGGGGGQPMS